MVGDHRPSLAAGNGFDGIEGETPHLAEGPQCFAFEGGAQGLAGVFYQYEPLLATEFFYLFNPRHGPAHMDRQHRLCSRGHDRLDGSGV